VKVRLACEPNGRDGCRRENLLHPLLHLRPELAIQCWSS
jgi:hypothetical protein